jgi:hypothetical protein
MGEQAGESIVGRAGLDDDARADVVVDREAVRERVVVGATREADARGAILVDTETPQDVAARATLQTDAIPHVSSDVATRGLQARHTREQQTGPVGDERRGHGIDTDPVAGKAGVRPRSDDAHLGCDHDVVSKVGSASVVLDSCHRVGVHDGPAAGHAHPVVPDVAGVGSHTDGRLEPSKDKPVDARPVTARGQIDTDLDSVVARHDREKTRRADCDGSRDRGQGRGEVYDVDAGVG